MVKHIEDYPTMNMDPWDFKFKGRPTEEEKAKMWVTMYLNTIKDNYSEDYSTLSSLKEEEGVRGK